MTSSTRSSDPPTAIGCGIDCEAAARFAPLLAADDHPLPMVFTRAEVDRARALPDPARALCACFCAKEAARKALGAPCNLTDCELVLAADAEPALRLAPALAAERGVAAWTVEISEVEEAPGVLMAVVLLFSAPPPR